MKPVWAIGLMTGTVLDGFIDVAAIRTDGESIAEFGHWTLAPYSDDVRKLLSAAVEAALEWRFTGAEPPIFRQAEKALTHAQSLAVNDFLAKAGLSPKEVAAIGFHGQTVLHIAPVGSRHGNTRQLGDGALMAHITGVDVAYDFRSDDMRAGGHGAPLSASYHAALLRKIGAAAPAAALNLGGVANITWWGGGDNIIAFDTGPANGPINDWIIRHHLGEMDVDGAIARRGKVDEPRLAKLLQHPFLSEPYPKSLDRYDFTAAMADGLDPADGAATLTAFTAATVGKALDLLPERPKQLIICGGGRKNPAIMDALKVRAKVEPLMAEDVGWRGDAIEAECFAYLAVRLLRGLPVSFPLTTGVKVAIPGGRLAKAA
ncbi:anhydro-N-acetylmuramic acid kinase [Terrarubrum flagellatum]|uniref:anhydro-N-acetylmuramic acid kinase n=1 Tax=Terrirubrum flagellatum TaxID=2895980 RepID=UPI0031450BD0